jgi:glutathione reductase (NADPH)
MKTLIDYDVVILGTGPSASRIAAAIANKRRVAIVESYRVGGTCALRGCNPKKVFVRATELIDWMRRSHGHLVEFDAARIDWNQLVQFTRSFTEKVPESSREKYRELGVQLYVGPTQFVDSQTVRVGDQTLRADRIVICTGAKPATLGISGEQHLVTSEQFLELQELPKRIVFVGGGYISFEFAHVARRAGAEVQILERGEQPLSPFDHDLVSQLVRYGSDLGIAVRTNCPVHGIEKNGETGYLLSVGESHNSEKIEADLVVHGAGRVPAIDTLDLEAANVKSEANGIVVNPCLQSTTNSRVYAAGDAAASGQPKLTPVANQEGRTVAKNLLTDQPERPEYGAVPKVVFTVPALASVGLNEQQASDQGYAFEVHQGERTEWSSLRKIGSPVAAHKILVDRKSDRILGAHLLGPDAAETINLFVLAINQKITSTQLKACLFAFPTFASDVRQMI